MKQVRNSLSLICVATLGIVLAATAAFAQPDCQLNPANRTVTICEPGNGDTVAATFHVNGGVTDTFPITYMQVYVNDQLYLTQFQNFIDGDITVPTGQNERLVMQARDSQGVFSKTTIIINVGQQPPPQGLNYVTWKNDNQRTGLQSKETILNPSNVNGSSFGIKFSTGVDGDVWPQPLYMSAVNIGGKPHDVVFVGTSKDSVYALDANSGAVLWRVSLLPPGATPVDGHKVHSSVPEIGIVGTPVIDPATGTLYAVTETAENNGTAYFHRLHALNVTNGAEKFGGPVVLRASGLDSEQQLQRPGLLLENGNVYIALGGNEDIDPYHGWVFSFRASTLGLQDVWNSTPGGKEGSVWQGAAGIAADKNGELYLATANGDWNGTTLFGQSAVHLSPSLNVVDYFTPFDWFNQNRGDKDLGSGGPVIIPDQNGNHPHEIVGCSKLNWVYVLDRDHMGHNGGNQDNIIQKITGQVGGNSGLQAGDKCFSNPAFWNHNLYFIGNNDSVKMFTLNESTGLMSNTPVSKGSFIYGFLGGQPVVSSTGTANGIVWAIDWTTSTLHAYDATNVSKALYVSGGLGNAIKFTAPTVVGGHVFMGLKKKVVGFGLVNVGGCTPPSSPGVNVCAPLAGHTYPSPVHFSAAGTGATPPVSRMELWIDGKKINDYSGNTINANVTLSVGSHAATAVEVDSKGVFIKSKVVTFSVH